MRVTLIPFLGLSLLLPGLTGCATSTQRSTASKAYVVGFSATRTADHAPLASVSAPVMLDGAGGVKTGLKTPLENQPALPEFRVRLKRGRQPGGYELVVRVSALELIRNKKGKLKRSERFLGALVPTRVGATEVVSTESDPIHLEARLERR